MIFRSGKNSGLAVIERYEPLLHEIYPSLSFVVEARGRKKRRRLAARRARASSRESPYCGYPVGNLSLELGALDEESRLRLKGVREERARKSLSFRSRGGRKESFLEISPRSSARALFSRRCGGRALSARRSRDESSLRADCERAFLSPPRAESGESK